MFKTIFKYAAVLSVFFIGSTHAATIIVNSSDGSIDPNDGVCSISEAIINANDDAQTHLDCAAGSGTDTIVLTSDIVLTAAYENDTTHGSTGTPTITSPIILDGMDYAIERDTALTCNMDGTNDNDEFRLMRIGSTGNITLDSITLSNGCADGFLEPSYGGAIYNEGDLAMENSTLSDSSARYSGGIDNQGTITTIQNSTFSGNSADYGGGIYNDGNINAIQNSTFSGNSANSNGGGIYNYYGTITSLRNSLFHNNTSGGNECVNNLGTFNGANNLSDDLSGGCPGLLSTALTPSTIGPLADNGGPTWTHALLPGSEAIDAGDSNSTTMDQRGMSAFGPRDIGAFEVQLSEFCPSPLQSDGFTTSVINVAELNQAIICANSNGNGTDTIELGADITLTAAYENDTTHGSTGTPTITSPIILDGMDYAIERDTALTCNIDYTNDSSEFRLMRIGSAGNLTLNNTTLSNGCTDGSTYLRNNGGAIFNEGDLAMGNSTISGSSARVGGGISNWGTINTIQNNTFSGNSAVAFGGGIYNDGTITTIQNSTLSGNSANANGGGVYNDNGIINTLQNSLFHNNTGGGNECVNNSGGTFNGANNLSDDLSGGCPGLLSTALTPSTIGPLADNGGPTLTHALLPGSEAIDMGDGNSTATDQRGFAALGDRDIGAFEAQPPVVTAPADVNVEATGPLTSPALGTATVVDAEEPGLIASPSMANSFPVGTTVVTWTATDSYGFVGSDTQNVTIVDTTPPVVTPPTDINMEATATMTPVSVGTASATDLVDGSLTPTSNAPASFPLGTTTVTWSATDASGNTGTATQSVTIVDTTPPVITITGSNPMQLNIGDTYTEAGATAVDLVDGTVTAVASGSVNTAVAGSYNITYQASDNQGNSSQAIRVVNVGVVRSFTGLLPSGQSGTLSFTSSDPNCSFISMPQFLAETAVTPAPQSQLIFLDGVVSFTIDNCAPGATVDMTLDYNQSIGPEFSYWKSGSPWFELPSTISGSSVSFSITDGATGDSDGSVDGSITDPSGLATVRAPAIPVPAGHLWTWLILIGLMLAGLGHQARKRQLM